MVAYTYGHRERVSADASAGCLGIPYPLRTAVGCLESNGMASWQFTCVVVPRSSWEERRPTSALEAFDSGLLWWDGMTVAQMSNALAGLGTPASDHWYKKSPAWGKTPDTIVETTADEDLLDDLRVRVDLRDDKPPYIHELIEIMSAHDWIFISEDGEEIPATWDDWKRAAQASDAFRFITNPSAYFEKRSERAGE